MNTLLSETLLRYSEDRSRFGKGPKKPNGTGHCSDEICGDAVGVRVWWHTDDDGVTTITDVWWTGQGCDKCMTMAALVAERMVGEIIDLESPLGGITMVSLLDDVPDLYTPDTDRCVMTAISAFDRAIWGLDGSRFDWTNLDMDTTGKAWESIEDYQDE